MLGSNAFEVHVGSSSPPREYETTSKSFLETMPGDLHTETAACRFLEPEVVARYRESNETSKANPRPESGKKKIESAGRSVGNRPRQSFSKSSASLQSLVRKRSRKHGASSLPLDVDLSSYSTHPGCLLLDTPNDNVTTYRNDEEICTTRTSTLIYGSSGQPSSRDNNAQDVSSTTNTVNVANTVTVTTSTSASNVTSSASGSHFGNTASSLIRTTSVITAGPSTSSWNNSTEQESDYVVDPVQGNAYYKGQFLGKVSDSK